MKKIIILLTFLLTSTAYSQFTDTIFTHYFSDINNSNRVLGLGDQNNDGADDILVYDGIEQKAKIYFGGSPMDTISTMEFSVWMMGAKTIDVNHNGFNDLIIQDYIPSLGTQIRIYYGGPLLDTIPDIILSPPEGASNTFGQAIFVLENFDGTENDVFVVKDRYLPFSNKELGAEYFYKTYPELDTIPFAVITGDSLTNYELGGIVGSGDINGDELTDFTTIGTENGYPYYRRNFYLGNANWNLNPSLTYKQEEHSYNITQMWLIEDINKDRKDDILTRDYDGTYPWWYYYAIWYGSFPIDTIPDHGINMQSVDGINSVCSPGDVNGDTFNDLLILSSFEQSFRLWLGSRIMHDDRDKWWESNTHTFGKIQVKVGDVDGDGVNDICIGFGDHWINRDYIFVIKGDTSVKIDTGTVSVKENFNQPENYILLNTYPNPFNPTTNIEYRISKIGRVSLMVYDILGREITKLIDNEEKTAREYETEFDASKYNLSSGVYIIRLEFLDSTGRLFKTQKKVQLIK